MAGIERQQHKAAAHQQQAERKFQPDAQHRTHAAFRAHQPRQHHAGRHHRYRVNRLEQRGRHVPVQQTTIDEVVDKQANRAPALLRQHPEQRSGEHQQDDLPQRATMLRGFDHDPRHHLGGEQADDRQQIAGPVVLQQQREKYRRQAEHHQQPAPGRQHELHRPQRRFIDAAGMPEVAAAA